MDQVFLSRRNLLTLLSKLDRKKAGDMTACTIIKYDKQGPNFNQTMPICAITAIEDDVYYFIPPGEVHPLDTPNVTA